jgi:Tfp pilus assembly protein PilN
VGTIDFHRLLTKVDMDSGIQWDPLYYNDALALAYMEAEGGKCPSFHRVSSPLRNYWSSYRSMIMAPAILLVLVLLLGLGGVLVDSYYLNKQVQLQNDQMAEIYRSTFPNSRLTAPPLVQMKSKMKETRKGQLAQQQTGAGIRTIDILLEISQRIPQSINVLFNRLTVGSDAVTVTGETADFNTVDDIKNHIEKSSYFKLVTIASANMDKSGKNVRFRLKIDL